MKYLIAIFLIASGGCSKNLEDDKLSISLINYSGSQLRMDGYYYESLENNTYFRAYVLYRNGVLMHVGSYPNSSLQEVDNDLRSPGWLPVIKDAKYMWGVYSIDANSIQFERWYPSEPPLRVYGHTGTILDDSTFKITEHYRVKGGVKTDITPGKNEVFHFRAFSPKPDSTNRFVP